MKMLGMKLVAAILLYLLLAGSIVGAGVYAQSGMNAANGDEEDVSKLRLRAEVLQRLLERAVTVANISESLRAEAENLTSVDLSSLSADELRSFIDEAKEVLAEIRESLNEDVILSGSNLAAKLLEKIELKLNNTLLKLNLTVEEAEQIRERIREKLQEKLTVRELAKLMKEVAKEVAHHKALKLSEHALNFTENATKSGAMHGLEVALNASSKVLEVLEMVKERLESVNASPVAVAAVEHSIEKIASAREVLKQVMGRVCSKHPGGKATKEQVKEELSSMLEEKLESLNETIDEYLEELLELRVEAEEYDLTSLVEELNQSIAELEGLKNLILSSNLSFSDVMSALASAKDLINHAEEVLEKASEEEELRSKISERLSEGIDEVKEELKDLREELEEIMDREGAEEVNDTLSLIDDLVKRAEENLGKGTLDEASKLLNEAEQMIKSVEHEIEHLEKMVEGSRGKSKAPPMSVGGEHGEEGEHGVGDMGKGWKNIIRLKSW